MLGLIYQVQRCSCFPLAGSGRAALIKRPNCFSKRVFGYFRDVMSRFVNRPFSHSAEFIGGLGENL